jgi:hypothetical protein
MTDTLYTEIVREPQKRSEPHAGICKLCGVGIPKAGGASKALARYCPVCIDRAARIYEAYALAGEAHRFHMGRLHQACYEWHVIEVAV